MIGIAHQEEPGTWAVQQFGAATLSDVRRVRRAVRIAEAMATKPGGSLPQLFTTPYEVKAAYTFFRHAEARPDRLQAGHREGVQQALQQPGEYLLLEDTTTMVWSGTSLRDGLGPIGDTQTTQEGFHLHTTLAVRWVQEERADEGRRPAVEVVGVCDQQYWVREPQRVHGRRVSSFQRKKRPRESQGWEQAGQRIGAAPRRQDVRWVRVGDRGADIYEHLQKCQELGHGFVVRAAQDRALLEAATGRKEGRLFSVARTLPALGELGLELRSRPTQPARRARLQVGARRICLGAPQRPGHKQGSQPPIPCTVIGVREIEPPLGVVPLEWILLVDVAVTTFAQALQCVLQYATRWMIEEYHKALKSGLGAERLQLETAAGLMAAIAIMSIVALRLLDLRERGRESPDATAEEAGLTPLELEVLRLKARRKLHTVREVALALGRLGGHLNRRSDGMPGWQTLWRGMNTLRGLVEGVQLARQLAKFG
jgi:Transposase DNA-binding/Transposase Tn5 dimerisation domain